MWIQKGESPLYIVIDKFYAFRKVCYKNPIPENLFQQIFEICNFQMVKISFWS